MAAAYIISIFSSRTTIWNFEVSPPFKLFCSDSIFILKKRYHNRAIITWEVYDEISAGITEYPALKLVDKLLSLTRKEHDLYL